MSQSSVSHCVGGERGAQDLNVPLLSGRTHARTLACLQKADAMPLATILTRVAPLADVLPPVSKCHRPFAVAQAVVKVSNVLFACERCRCKFPTLTATWPSLPWLRTHKVAVAPAHAALSFPNVVVLFTFVRSLVKRLVGAALECALSLRLLSLVTFSPYPLPPLPVQTYGNFLGSKSFCFVGPREKVPLLAVLFRFDIALLSCEKKYVGVAAKRNGDKF